MKTVSAVLHKMSRRFQYLILAAKEYRLNGERVLLVQASNRYHGDDDEEGQLYYFIWRNGAWRDISECFNDARAVWHTDTDWQTDNARRVKFMRTEFGNQDKHAKNAK